MITSLLAKLDQIILELGIGNYLVLEHKLISDETDIITQTRVFFPVGRVDWPDTIIASLATHFPNFSFIAYGDQGTATNLTISMQGIWIAFESIDNAGGIGG